MNYQDFPAFKGITPEIEAYLDRFDDLLKKNNLNLSPEEILVRKIELFSDYIDEKGKKNFAKNIEENLQKQAGKNGGVSLFFLARGMYGNRRNVDNEKKMGDREYYNLIENWKAKENGLKISLGDGLVASGWVYKTSPNYNPKKDLHRFILNVDPNSNLFEKLDKFALEYNCQYKCAESQREAYSRPDTIVIYTSDERIEEQKKILSSLIKPYVRTNGNSLLDGEKLEDGLHYATEKSRADIQNLIEEAKGIYPRLAHNLTDILNNTTKNHPLSLGEFTIYKDILDSMKVLKNPNPQQKNINLNLNKNKQQSTQSVLEKGIKVPFTQSVDAKISLIEIKNTENANYSIDSKNPNLLNIEGFDKDKKCTFSLQYNKSTGTYLYQGGKPEKIYSNNPDLNFAPLPEDVLRQIKNNQRTALNKAFVKAEMRNGIEITENDSVISIKQEKVGEHENCFVFEKKQKDGTPISKFVVDRENGEYVAFNYKTGERFTNAAKLSDKNLPQLPAEVIKRYQNRIKQAEQTIINSRININLNQQQRQ